MTAMSGPRVPIEKEGRSSNPPVKGSTTIHQGALVVMESGLAIPGKVGTGLTAIGIAEESVVNSGADGAKRVVTRRGTFKFFNSADADEVTAADIGKDCFVVDDQTVAKTNGTNTRSAAGAVIDVEADGGVFVRLG